MHSQRPGRKVFKNPGPDWGVRVVQPTAAAAFLPTDLPNLVAWYRADLGTFQDNGFTVPAVNDGDPVGGWQDQSGNGWDVSQAVVGNRMTLRLNVYNGEPAVEGDIASDYLGGAFPDFPDACTLFVVFTIINVPADPTHGIVEVGTGAVNSGFLVLYDAGNIRFRVRAAGFWTISSAQALPYTAILSGIYSGAATSIDMWLDGVQIGPAAAGAAFDNVISNIDVGRIPIAGYYLNGRIAELIVYSDAKGAADQGTVETYLNSRYAIF